MIYRKAEQKDIKDIAELINETAKKASLLPRTKQEIRRMILGFWVCHSESQDLIGCCGSKQWKGINPEIEIISLVVKPEYRRQGIGQTLARFCVWNCLENGFRTFFTLTTKPSLFEKIGFEQVDKKCLPHKVAGDCISCPKNNGIDFYSVECDEIALILQSNGFIW